MSAGLRAGYKQTEVGVIPEDWEVKSLGNIAPLQRGFDLPESQLLDGDCPVVYSNGIMNFHKCAMVKGPGVVTGRSGTLGKVHYVDRDYWPHNTSLWVTSFCGNEPKFVYYLYAAIGFSRFTSGSGVPTLNRNDAHAYRTIIPSTSTEQRAIATVLSDIDALLAKLDALIAKKRDLKVATMQQILTGQTRLPGFSGEWAVKRLDALADIRSGGTPSTTDTRFWNGDVPWCTPTDITGLGGFKYLRQTSRMITNIGLAASSAELIPVGSIVMTSRATIGECAINSVPMTTNQGFKNFIPFPSTDIEFLYYLLQTKKQDFIGLCSGSTFLEIGKTQLIRFEVKVPVKTEQTAIATILSDMDTELTALQAHRNKTRALKQGMMQELLTGRIRIK